MSTSLRARHRAGSRTLMLVVLAVLLCLCVASLLVDDRGGPVPGVSSGTGIVPAMLVALLFLFDGMQRSIDSRHGVDD